jgi:hypothetical protein
MCRTIPKAGRNKFGKAARWESGTGSGMVRWWVGVEKEGKEGFI